MGGRYKPLVWTHAFRNEDPLQGWIPEFEAHGREFFDFVTTSDLEKNPEKSSLIKGALLHGDRGSYLYKFLPAMTNLKVIANAGAGVNHLDLPALAAKGIKVSNTPGVVSYAVAELAISLILASFRCLMKGNHDAKETTNAEYDGNDLRATELRGSTVGIVGMGNIGLLLAKLLHPFQAKIVYHNRNKRSEEEERSVGAVFYPSLDEMLTVCDVVVLVCPLTSQTKHLIGREQFKLMKNTATIVNVARGAVVDTDALVEALSTQQIKAAALDVTDPEPLPAGHALRYLDNVIVVPHVGTQTMTTRFAMFRTAVKNLRACLIDGVSMPNEIKA